MIVVCNIQLIGKDTNKQGKPFNKPGMLSVHLMNCVSVGLKVFLR